MENKSDSSKTEYLIKLLKRVPPNKMKESIKQISELDHIPSIDKGIEDQVPQPLGKYDVRLTVL